MSTADATLIGQAPAAQQRRPLRWLGRAVADVVSVRTWCETAYLLTDLWVGIVSVAVLVPLIATSLGLLVLFPVALVLIWSTLLVARVLGRFERLRLDALLGTHVDSPHLPDPEPKRLTRLRHRAFSGATWREIGHLVLQLPAGAIATVLTVVAWAVPLTLLTLPLTQYLLPGRDVHLWSGHVLHAWSGAGLGFVLGLVLLPFVPTVVHALAEVDRRLAAALLGPSRSAQLDERVDVLQTSRAKAMDAAEHERRRIERDLHDGAQQRLVALAMDLGMARQKLAEDPEAAGLLLDEAHAEAKRALVELRDLARGIHPAVLTDRGLGPALSAVAARSSVPVTLDVQLADRMGPTVEGIAYFVVCEALTNVVRHAGGTRARVTAIRRGDRLVLEIADDGHGGADASHGTGLAGLRDRVEAVDGWFHVSSPPGGPTSILVELPCAS